MAAVYKKYPITEMDRKCRTHKRAMQEARDSYKQKILDGKVDLDGNVIKLSERVTDRYDIKSPS